MLQNQMIVNLKIAWATDASVNFDNLQDTSDDGQDRALMCLLHLQQRILVKRPIERPIDNLAMPTSNPPRLGQALRNETWNSQTSTILPPSRGSTNSEGEPKKGGLLSNFGFRRSKASGQKASRIVDISDTVEEPMLSSPSPNQSRTPRQSPSTRPPEIGKLESNSPNPSIVMSALLNDQTMASVPVDDGIGLGILPKPPSAGIGNNVSSDHPEYNPWGEMRTHESATCDSSAGSYFSSNSEKALPQSPGVIPTQPTLLSPHALPPPPSSHPSTSPQHAKRTSPSFSRFRSRTNSSTVQDKTTSRPSPPASLNHRSSTNSDVIDAITPITPQSITSPTQPVSWQPNGDFLPCSSNNFAGFCRGAFKMQIGETQSAIQERFRPGATLTQMIPYWKCTKCSFEGRMVKGLGGEKSIDMKPYTCEGIPYRWQFLLKCHVHQKGERKLGEANFACLFCCSEGRGTVTYGGLQSFFSHLQEHRTRVPSGGVVYRVKVISGRLAMPDEDFDVNLI